MPGRRAAPACAAVGRHRPGVQAAELNAVEESSIYQKICINNGEDVAWSFAHKARSPTAPNQMAFVVGGNCQASCRMT